MTVKRTPHHDLAAIQTRFGDVRSLEITLKATRDAQAPGYSLEDVVDVVQALETGDVVKSETATIRPIQRSGTTATASRSMGSGSI